MTVLDTPLLPQAAMNTKVAKCPFLGGYRFYNIRLPAAAPPQRSGKATYRRKLRQPPDGVGKSYPGELPTSADSCQHCRTLSENRTAVAVYRGVAKRDTLPVELTRHPQTGHRNRVFIGLQGMQRHTAINFPTLPPKTAQTAAQPPVWL